MTKKIFKYELDMQSGTNCLIMMPKGAQVLTVQMQNDKPYVWALVDPEVREISMLLEIFGTGQNIFFDDDETRDYIGTFQTGVLVFHVFLYTGI